MIRALLLAELRAQRVFIFLVIAFLLIDVVDDLTLHTNFSLAQFNGELSGMAMMLLIASFAIGSGLLMRELDNGTLSFIDGLPMTRLQLFVVKVIVALIILQLFSLMTIAISILRHVITSNSLNREVHANLLLADHVLLLTPILMGLSAGLLLGFLRSMSWLVFAALGMTIAALSEKWPAFTALNPQQLFDGALRGNHVHWPARALIVQSAMISVAILSAAKLFSITDPQRYAIRIDSKKWVAIPLTILSIVVTGMGSYFLINDGEQSDRSGDYKSGARFEQSPPGNASTIHYAFSYPANRSESVALLIKRADQIFENVENTLRIESGANIDVDLNGSMLNTEGTAFPNRIRMNLNKHGAVDTLAHETTHVFARRLVGDAGEAQLASMVVFNEGLARWVERSLSADKNQERDDELAVAAASARHVLDAQSLTNIQDMAKDIDENLKYPLGRLFVDCLIKRYGDEAPRNILKAIGREDFPRDLAGFSLWQTAFQLAGYDVSLIFDDYARRMRLLKEKYKQQVLMLPRLHGDLVVRDDDIGVEIHADKNMPDGWRAIVRFKPTADSSLDMYIVNNVEDNLSWTAKELLGSGDVCFQPGVTNGYVSIYEVWTCLPVSSASEL